MLNGKHSKRYTWEGNFLKQWYFGTENMTKFHLVIYSINANVAKVKSVDVSISRQLWLKFKSARIQRQDVNSGNQKAYIFVSRMLWRLRVFFTNGNLIFNNKDMNLKYRQTVADLRGHQNLFIRESYLKNIMLSKYSWNSMSMNSLTLSQQPTPKNWDPVNPPPFFFSKICF